LLFDIHPDHPGVDFIPCQIPVRHIMREFLGVFSGIRQRIIDLAYQQVLAAVQSRYSFIFGIHLLDLSGCAFFVNSPVLRKSYIIYLANHVVFMVLLV
jgi:hypothetical protein